MASLIGPDFEVDYGMSGKVREFSLRDYTLYDAATGEGLDCWHSELVHLVEVLGLNHWERFHTPTRPAGLFHAFVLKLETEGFIEIVGAPKRKWWRKR